MDQEKNEKEGQEQCCPETACGCGDIVTGGKGEQSGRNSSLKSFIAAAIMIAALGVAAHAIFSDRKSDSMEGISPEAKPVFSIPGCVKLSSFSSLNKDTTDKDFISYSIGKKFKAGDRISHPTFGNGSVLQENKPNKIDVLFKDGQKLLVCNIKKE